MPQAGRKGLVGTVCGWNKPEGATLMEICGWAQKLHRPDQNPG